MLCTFATRVGPLDPVSAVNQVVGSICYQYNSYLSAKGWVNTIREWNDEIRRFAEQKDIRLIDCAEALTGNRAIFRDYIHFTKLGHETLAEIVSLPLLNDAICEES